jgi:exonuclease SbcC
MIIKKLILQNIRSHVNSTVEFDEGFNCVVGGVGAGKTSILLALHFALFGEPLHRSYEYLLREDKNMGRVILEFEHAGKNYQLIRVLKRERGGRIAQDPSELRLTENGKVLAWGRVVAVQEQLKSIIGIDKKMFEEFIWVQQEKLKEILNMTPRERQEILDELFGFSAFKKAWEHLLPYQRHYEAIKTTLEKDPDIIELENLRRQYEDLMSDLIKLQVEVETLEIDLSEVKKRLKEAEETLQSLEALEREVEKLKEEKSQLANKLSETQAYINSLKTQINNKKLEVKDYEKNLEQLKSEKTRILSQLSKTSLEELSRTVKDLELETGRLRDEVAGLRAEIKKAEESLLVLETENVCPTCRREINPSFREELRSQLNKENLENQQKISMLEAKLENLEFEHKLILEAKTKIELLETQIAEIEKSTQTKRKEIDRLMEELTEKEKLEHELKTRLDEVSTKILEFKVEDVENARKIREEQLLKYNELLNTIKHQKKLIEEKKSYVDSVEKRIQNAEEKLKRKGLVEKVLKIIVGLRAAYREVVPLLRGMYVEGLREAVQSVLDSLTVGSGRNFYVEIDDEYTPTLMGDSGFRRDASLISGGERTWLALAYRIGLGQLIMEAKTGQSLELLILDEPTEALGTEDKSIDALATAISNLKMVRQILTVTHSEELAKEASTRILVTKKDGVSSIEKI